MYLRERAADLVKQFGFKTLLLLGLLLISRLVAMYWIPLNDSTEARYAEIARLMLTSHNWVSLMHYPGQYFWAKPPLSTWLSAATMQVFGVTPFFSRLPAWILSLLSLALIAKMAKTQWNSHAAFWSVAVLITCIYFLLDAGTVMTDPALLTCTVLVMVSFWMAMHGHGRIWAYLLFIGWGLGLLVKGLATGIFTVLPIASWLMMERAWKSCWKTIPWVKGTILTLAIATPWYILAELRTPGFLSYFFIGEHFMRYLQPGWSGNLYGFAHQAPYGMIWIYFILGVMPWSGVLMVWAFSRKEALKFNSQEKSWQRYILSFMLVPLVVFTFAGNIIYPYVFPCIPAFALWFTAILMKAGVDNRFRRFFDGVAIVLMMILFIVSYLFNQYPEQLSKSNDRMIAAWKEDRQSNQERLIYSMMQPEYSSMFYSAGEALATRDEAQLCAWLSQGPQYVVLNSDEPSQYDEFIAKSYAKIYEQRHRNRVDTLYRVDSVPMFCQ